jgi:anti-sigma regulatory factor (Ser/Thr protein kinase)
MQLVLRNVLPRSAILECSLPPDLPPVRIARHLLSQAIFNLVQNAGDAIHMQERGTVRVWAERVDDGIRIGVTDDGPGMNEEVQRRCMEPFFTTKSRSISTGLGLSLVHGIVQRVGGDLTVRSRPGSGTTFSFKVPVAARAAAGHVPPGSLEACVSLADKRMRSLAASLLASRGVAMVPSLEQMSGAGVWVTDAKKGLRAELDRFLGAGGRRRAVVLGEGGSDLAGPGVLAIDHPATPTVLRSALYDATTQCAAGDFRLPPVPATPRANATAATLA